MVTSVCIYTILLRFCFILSYSFSLDKIRDILFCVDHPRKCGLSPNSVIRYFRWKLAYSFHMFRLMRGRTPVLHDTRGLLFERENNWIFKTCLWTWSWLENLHFCIRQDHDVNLGSLNVVTVVANNSWQFHSTDFINLFCLGKRSKSSLFCCLLF